MIDPTTIASLALATVTTALGVAAWLEGRPDRSGSAVGLGSADKTGYILDYPRIGSPAYRLLAGDTADHDFRPLRNIVTPADLQPKPPKRRAF